MRTSELLAHLKGLSVRVWSEGGELRCSAPRGVLTPELREELGARKREILEALESAGRRAADGDDVIPRAPRERELPLSFTQQRLWFLQRLDPELTAYNIPMSWTLSGPLDAAALARALAEIVRRHEVLRTAFPTVQGRPVPEPLEPGRIRLERLEVTGEDAEARRDCVRRALQQKAREPFELHEGPLVRPSLARVAESEHVLFVLVHHIVFDGGSIEGFLGELRELYAAFADGRPSPLEEPAIQYVDYAVWQRARLSGAGLERDLEYWRAALGGGLPLLELPLDHPRPPVQTYLGAKRRRALPARAVRALGELAGGEGATLFMALLAAYKALLARTTGLEDAVVAAPIAGRERPELARLLGFFANTLVLRTSTAGDPSFRELLGRVRETCLGAFGHQEMPFERLVDELQPERNLSHSPLFQTLFLMEESVGRDARMGAVAIEPFELETFVARTDLMLYVYRAGDDWSVWAEYNTDLFEAATVDRLLEHYVNLIESALEDPDARLSGLRLLSPAERARVVSEWNDTAADFPETPVFRRIEQQTDRTPEATALVWPSPEGEGGGDDDVALSYRELDERANRLARHLVERGVRPDALVGLCLERSADLLVADLAIQKAGAAYVPLDPGFPRDRLAYMVSDSGLALVVTTTELEPLLEGADVTRVRVDAEADEIAARASTRLELDVPATARMYVIYTSGSTGRPKGVELEHRSVSNFLATMSREPGLSSEDTWLAVTTLSFDISVYELMGPLVVGGTVIVAPKEATGDGESLRGLLERLRPTVMQATPAMWRMLLLAGWRGDPDGPDGERGLRIFCGGEALPRELANELLPLGREVWNLYGPTEATIWSTLWRVEPGEGPILIGAPIGNTQVYVLDGNLEPVPIGVSGELWIGGEGLARGYLERPELTAERFRPDPFQGGGRLYRTGDLARWRANGLLECLGRVDSQVKLRGFRIELGEIESVVAEDPGVVQCAAVVREDAPGDQRLVVYYVSSGGEAPPLRERAREKLPAYMIPSSFTQLGELPLTPNGKLDRLALARRDTEPAPLPDEEYVAPRNEIERRIADIWRSALRAERVAVHTNFFDLGGHSLLLAEVHARMQDELGVSLSMVDLFQFPTVAGVASHLDGGGDGRGANGARRERRRDLATGRRALRRRRRARG